VIERLIGVAPQTSVARRDLAETRLPFVDQSWIGANFTDPAERDDEQKAALALSDQLVAELKAADTIVIGLPVYNFGIPAALKAWVDLIARARETFRYTENGPVGLLENKRAILVYASGGTPAGSDIDFASTYMKHILGFVGITDVTVINAGQQMTNGAEAIDAALSDIRELAA